MPGEGDHGALTEGVFLILLSLLTPRHGYAVMQHVGRLTKGRVMLGAGTLYGAINSLLERGWITSVDDDEGDSRRKRYVITDIGREALAREQQRLTELLAIAAEEQKVAQK